MKVLVMGLRQGLCRALERRKIPYILWNHKEVSSKLRAEKIVVGPYMDSEADFFAFFDLCKINHDEFSHVIAGSEAPVIYASLARKWLKVERNPHTLILKCTDKLTMKKFLHEKGIPMTQFADIKKYENREELVEKLGLPLVVKGRNSSGGRDVKFHQSLSDSEFEILKKNARKLDLYGEAAVKGSEGSIESFVQDHNVIFTNITQYYVLGHCNIIPGLYSQELNSKIRDLNEQVIRALKIKWGMTHLEYYITDEGPLFGEIAIRPPGGHIMDCLELSYGENFWEHFLDVELHQKDLIFSKCQAYSAAYIFHPGKGKVMAIEGTRDLARLANIEKWRFKLNVGDEVETRVGGR